MMENMPPGFRFYPTEEELVTFYLRKKLEDNSDDGLNQLMDRVIPVVNIYDYNPHQLPQLFSEILCHRDTEQWFFFVPRQESEARGGRPNRLTATGYWKATGSPGHVFASNRPVGEKKTMVFYVGKAPHGRKTEWKMNEYKAIDGEASTSNGANSTPVLRQEMSLCRIYKKSKCLRAFDRRPLPHEGGMMSQPPPRPPISSAPAAAHHQPRNYYVDHHHHHDMMNINPSAGDYAHHHQMAPGVTASSPESSSSGDHPHHGHHYHQQNMESAMNLDDEPWDNLLDLLHALELLLELSHMLALSNSEVEIGIIRLVNAVGWRRRPNGEDSRRTLRRPLSFSDLLN